MPNEKLLAEAVKAAQMSDVAIILPEPALIMKVKV